MDKIIKLDEWNNRSMDGKKIVQYSIITNKT